jgi:putative ABC transport system permease protein
VRLALTGADYSKPEQQIAFVNALLPRIQSAPGVEAVGTINFFPLSGSFRQAVGFEIEGGPAMTVAERPLTHYFSVSPDYFRAMGVPLKEGRFFSERDDAKTRPVAIINQTLARQYFPNQSPIGKRITIQNPSDEWREIVGVVGDVAQSDLGELPPAQFYESHAQKAQFGIVVVRGRGNPALLPAIVKREVQALDSNIPLGDISTVEDFVHNKLTVRRLMLHLLTAFAGIGLFIAAIGIYGVMAFSVSQRTVEIGIRMALGAQKGDVLRMVITQGAWMVGLGFAIGIVATVIAGHAMASQLYNTSGYDPLSLLAITIFFGAVAALACWLPARRAMNVDPIVALRAE